MDGRPTLTEDAPKEPEWDSSTLLAGKGRPERASGRASTGPEGLRMFPPEPPASPRDRLGRLPRYDEKPLFETGCGGLVAATSRLGAVLVLRYQGPAGRGRSVRFVS